MPRLLHILPLTIAIAALAGCSRDAIRDMGSLKDDHHAASPSAKPAKTKSAEGLGDEEKAVSKAAVAGTGESAASSIETGSIPKPNDCQGEHIAYQATREYLKNFGPKPPDEPGERGPCRPAQ